MTRINLIDPSHLTDQHLFAEYREITRLFALVKNASDKHPAQHIIAKIPPTYRLGAGHVVFFYDKLAFIERRYVALRDELVKRHVNITPKDTITDFRHVIDERFYQDYTPDNTALALSISRLIEKIQAKPNWYRWYGKVIDDEAYQKLLKHMTS